MEKYTSFQKSFSPQQVIEIIQWIQKIPAIDQFHKIAPEKLLDLFGEQHDVEFLFGHGIQRFKNNTPFIKQIMCDEKLYHFIKSIGDNKYEVQQVRESDLDKTHKELLTGEALLNFLELPEGECRKRFLQIISPFV